MKTLSTLLATATLLSLAACGGKAGDIINKATHGEKKASLAELAFTSGIWKSGCVSNGVLPNVLGLPIKAQETVYDVHTSGSMTRTTTYFAQTDCTEASANVLEDVQFAFGSQLTGDNYAFDMTFRNEKVTPLSDDAVNLFNKLTGYCNITNWEKNKPQDVNAQSGAITCPGVEKVNRTLYGVIQITGGGNKEMYLNEGTTTTGARPQVAATDAQHKYGR